MISAGGEWHEAHRTAPHSNWVIHDDLTINAAIRPLPKITGTVLWNCAGIASVGVFAYDHDTFSADDFMGSAETDPSGHYEIRLETLEDATLPADGPGFHANGNFMLTEITLDAHPASEPETFALLGLAFAGIGFARRRRLNG